MKQLQQLGWNWHENGVIVSVTVDGEKLQVFVPLQKVWLTFDEELQAVGCPSAASVGAPFSVGGFFSFIGKAAKSIVKKVVPKAIRKAASRVYSVAKKYGGAAVKGIVAVGRNPIFRGAVIAASFAVPALAPAAAALELANQAAKYYDQGMAAANAIKQGVRTVENVVAVGKGLVAKKSMAKVIQRAHAGDTHARQIVGAMQHRLVNRERFLPGGAQALRHAMPAVQRARLQAQQQAQRAQPPRFAPYYAQPAQRFAAPQQHFAAPRPYYAPRAAPAPSAQQLAAARALVQQYG